MDYDTNSLLRRIPSDSQALLFDCDGTIAHTMPLHEQAWIETLANYGIHVERGFVDEFAGRPTPTIVEILAKRYQVDMDPGVVSKERDIRADALLDQTTPIAPVVAVISHFANRIPMAVISGGSRVHVEKTLAHLALAEYFAEVLTADDPYPGKPNPDLFLEVARRFSVPADKCVVFEDAELGLEAARAAGMHAIDVRTISGYPTAA